MIQMQLLTWKAILGNAHLDNRFSSHSRTQT
jgi:hypothetical protein